MELGPFSKLFKKLTDFGINDFNQFAILANIDTTYDAKYSSFAKDAFEAVKLQLGTLPIFDFVSITKANQTDEFDIIVAPTLSLIGVEEALSYQIKRDEIPKMIEEIFTYEMTMEIMRKIIFECISRSWVISRDVFVSEEYLNNHIQNGHRYIVSVEVIHALSLNGGLSVLSKCNNSFNKFGYNGAILLLDAFATSPYIMEVKCDVKMSKMHMVEHVINPYEISRQKVNVYGSITVHDGKILFFRK